MNIDSFFGLFILAIWMAIMFFFSVEEAVVNYNDDYMNYN